MRTSFSVLATFSVLAVALAGENGKHTITVINNCPDDISLFKDGFPQGYLASHGGSKDFTVAKDYSGLFMSSANGGSQSGFFTTKAGFYFPNNEYYIVRDEQYFNTGISIVPVDAQYTGNCAKAVCSSPNCGTNAFTSAPTGFSGKPQAPLFQCNKPGWDYTVTFCPGGQFPPTIPNKAVMHHPAGRRDPGQPIHPSENSDYCLTIQGIQGTAARGSPVVINKCTGSAEQMWAYQSGTTQIRQAGTEFCLDALNNNMQPCADPAKGEWWTLTEDRRFQNSFKEGSCLTNTNYGSMVAGNPVTTAPCAPNNENQVWS